jgi:hypothetical protein
VVLVEPVVGLVVFNDVIGRLVVLDVDFIVGLVVFDDMVVRLVVLVDVIAGLVVVVGIFKVVLAVF